MNNHEVLKGLMISGLFPQAESLLALVLLD